MRTFLVTLFLLILNSAGYTQNQNSEVRYLLSGHDNLVVTGFGGFSSQFGLARGKASLFSGGGGAVLLNYNFFVGGFGMGLSQMNSFDNVRLSANSDLINDLTYSYGIGGMWVGYSFNHQSPIHFAASLKSGVGAITVFPKSFEHLDRNLYTDVVYSFFPELLLEINMLRWWRVQFQAGYLFTMNIDNKIYYNESGEPKKYFDNKDFTTPMIGFSMMFGVFGPKKNNE